jgi:hypothetical protein
MTVRNLNFPLRNVQLSLHYRDIFILMKMSPLFVQQWGQNRPK